MGILFGYSYAYEPLHNNFVLIKAINESVLAPKLILPLIEKNLKSGNNDFYPAVKNPKEAIATKQLNKKQKAALNAIIKNCPEAHQIKIHKISNSTNKRSSSQ
jgi:hypothetical protein